MHERTVLLHTGGRTTAVTGNSFEIAEAVSVVNANPFAILPARVEAVEGTLGALSLPDTLGVLPRSLGGTDDSDWKW